MCAELRKKDFFFFPHLTIQLIIRSPDVLARLSVIIEALRNAEIIKITFFILQLSTFMSFHARGKKYQKSFHFSDIWDQHNFICLLQNVTPSFRLIKIFFRYQNFFLRL